MRQRNKLKQSDHTALHTQLTPCLCYVCTSLISYTGKRPTHSSDRRLWPPKGQSGRLRQESLNAEECWAASICLCRNTADLAHTSTTQQKPAGRFSSWIPHYIYSLGRNVSVNSKQDEIRLKQTMALQSWMNPQVAAAACSHTEILFFPTGSYYPRFPMRIIKVSFNLIVEGFVEGVWSTLTNSHYITTALSLYVRLTLRGTVGWRLLCLTWLFWATRVER